MGDDERYVERAVELARRAGEEGSAPVGAVIVLDGSVVGEGRSRVSAAASFDPGRHAEMEAIADVELELWSRAGEMTCYTTLEPCVMCAGTLLVYGVGRVVYGARDRRGGAGPILDHLPPYYVDRGLPDWEGPVASETCGPLRERVRSEYVELGDEAATEHGGVDESVARERLRAQLDEWIERPERLSIPEARRRIESLVERLEPDAFDRILPYAAEIFRRGGYLKDYRALERHARRAGRPEALERVEETVRAELPDIWVRRALEAGDCESAIERWFEIEDHPRARHVADELLEACGRHDAQVLISCRLAEVSHRIGRGTRRHYREACARLRKLRDELERIGASEYWHHVLAELRADHSNRPAFLDELDAAGFD